MKIGLVLAVLLAGLTATLAQVILVRELLVTFGGNELYIGVILANWLLLEALGSYLSSRLLAKREGEMRSYAGLQLAVAVFLPAAVYGARLARNLSGSLPGEAVGLSSVFRASMILLAPLAVAHGAQFTSGCRAYARLAKTGAASIAQVYTYEATGTLIGGFVFTFFLVSRVNAMDTVLGVAALNLASAVWLGVLSAREPTGCRGLSRLNRGACLPLLGLGMLACTGYLLLGPGPYDLHAQSIRLQWKPHRLLGYENSNYGNIAVVKREDEFTFYSNGVPIATTPNPDESLVEDTAHLPMLFHGSPRDVLVLGGGVGGLLNEILKHPVERLDCVEPDPLLIEVVRRFPTPLTESELGDARLTLWHEDARLFVGKAREQYDVIIVNLPSPSTLQLNRFYTVEFFRAAKAALREDGILALTCPGSLAYVGQEMADLIACFRLTLCQVFPHVRPIAGDSVLLLASPSPGICAVNDEVLTRRLSERALETRVVSGPYLRYRLDEERTGQLIAALDRRFSVGINRDLVPLGLFYNMSLLGMLVFPKVAGVFRLIGRASLWTFLLPLAVLLAATIAALRRRRSKPTAFPVPYATFTNGLAGMAIQMVLILAFQSLCGNVYRMIGLLVAAFMAGLAGGSAWMSRAIERTGGTGPRLARLDLLVCAHTLLVPAVLVCVHARQGEPTALVLGQAAILTLSLATGALVGSEYALAAQVYFRITRSVGRAGGTLYAADLAGAWVGALLVSTWLIPVLGIVQTCIVVAALKGTSLLLVRLLLPSEGWTGRLRGEHQVLGG